MKIVELFNRPIVLALGSVLILAVRWVTFRHPVNYTLYLTSEFLRWVLNLVQLGLIYYLFTLSISWGVALVSVHILHLMYLINYHNKFRCYYLQKNLYSIADSTTSEEELQEVRNSAFDESSEFGEQRVLNLIKNSIANRYDIPDENLSGSLTGDDVTEWMSSRAIGKGFVNEQVRSILDSCTLSELKLAKTMASRAGYGGPVDCLFTISAFDVGDPEELAELLLVLESLNLTGEATLAHSLYLLEVIERTPLSSEMDEKLQMWRLGIT